jgi:drug/metabolite transporter (DMT)-like permease
MTLKSSLKDYKIPFLIALFCTLWSSAFTAAKVSMASSPPMLFLTARFLLAGAVMLAAAGFSSQSLPSRRDIGALILVGVLNNALYLSLSFSGMGTVSAGLAALITSCNPILTAIAASIFLRERLTLRKIAGLIIGFCGVAFIVRNRISGGVESMEGVLLIVAALFALVAATILFKLLNPRGGLWIGNGIQNMAAGLALLPVALCVENTADVTPNLSLLGALLYLALGVSMVGLLAWFYLLTVAGPTAASSYHFLTPPLGVFFGWLVLGETISLPDMLGIVPVVYGISLVTRPARPASKAIAAQQAPEGKGLG